LSNLLQNAATVVLVGCAIVVTGLVARRELSSPATTAARPAVEHVANGLVYAREGHVMGSTEAPVSLVVFSDFECPACRTLAERVQVLRTRHPKAFNVVYRHFPIPTHLAAAGAARASECAANQGRFEAFHDAVFADQRALGEQQWRRFAETAQVRDLSAFDQCTADTSRVEAIERDINAGHQLALDVTPTILINNQRLRGVPPLDELERLVTQTRPRAQ